MANSTVERPGRVAIREFGYETPRARTLLARARRAAPRTAVRALAPAAFLATPRIIAAATLIFNRLVRRDLTLAIALLAGGMALASLRRSR